METTSGVFLYASLYALFNVSGAGLIKAKLLDHKIHTVRQFVPFLMDPKMVLALCLIVVSMFFSIKALSLSTFSSVIPVLTAVNFVLTVGVGVLYFNDRLSFASYVGLLMILAGVFLVSRGFTG